MLFLLLLSFSCREETPTESEFPTVPTEGPISSIIRNPVSADKRDTVNIAKLTFAQTEYDFGEVQEGAKVTHRFPFTNTGNRPLLITDARSTCGCTVPKYPQTPIAPGESDIITVVFDTKGKKGYQRKPVSVTANTYPSVTEVYVKGQVQE